MDKWCVGRKSNAKGGIPLTKIPYLEYHIEGLNGPIRINIDMGHYTYLEYEITLDERREPAVFVRSIPFSSYPLMYPLFRGRNSRQSLRKDGEFQRMVASAMQDSN